MSIIIHELQHIYSEGTAYEKMALHDINLKIEEGEFVGLIGHTGSGKSTLIQHLNGLLKPTSGSIYYDGEDIHDRDYSLKRLRSKVGLVFQYPEHQLFESRVLAMDPEVMILDEPTAGLDPEGRDEILELVKSLHRERNITVILVSHSMEDIARYAGRLIVMNQGTVQYDGSPAQVFSHYKELEEIGLMAPQVTYVMEGLAERGIALPHNAITVQEAVDSILTAKEHQV